MSSVNHFPTFKYSQPADYHFSHDSVFLAREVFERHRALLSETQIKVLDLCAGCGIVGLDLLFHQLKEESFQGEIDFLEVQEVYQNHFETNLQTLQNIFLKTLQAKWIQNNYANILCEKKYDLIVSNPPYFLVNQGKLSTNPFKNRCRFFIDSDLQMLIQFIKNSLKINGFAYLLVRDELKKTLEASEKNISFPYQIRGTWVGLLKGA